MFFFLFHCKSTAPAKVDKSTKIAPAAIMPAPPVPEPVPVPVPVPETNIFPDSSAGSVCFKLFCLPS